MGGYGRENSVDIVFLRGVITLPNEVARACAAVKPSCACVPRQILRSFLGAGAQAEQVLHRGAEVDEVLVYLTSAMAVRKL